jgi:hypothetical protein|tara:strand:+ start:8601 stop:8924 length:324 start_codon:yes stop_codon:yes gene_type:complete
MADQLVTLLTNARVGQGGNSTSPAATDLDVDIGAADGAYTTSAIKSENTVEYSLKIAGSNTNLTGKSIREAAFFDSNDNMLARLHFTAIGPIANTSDLEIFFILEVE